MKRKGFTLIELLAVIVVLAVIALISMPLVLNTIDKARIGAFKTSIKNIKDSAEYYQEKGLMNGTLHECVYFSFDKNVEEKTVIDGKTYIPIKELSMKGNLPTTGEIKVCTNEIEMDVGDGTYRGIYDDNNYIVAKKDDIASSDETVPTLNITYQSTLNEIKVNVDAKAGKYGGIKDYYYSINSEKYIKEENPIHIFNNLKPNTDYKIKVYVVSKASKKSEEKELEVTTRNFEDCSIDISDKGIWTTSKVAKISGTTDGTKLQYKVTVQSDPSKNIDWTDYIGDILLETDATNLNPINVYCRFVDNNLNASGAKSESIATIDTSIPMVYITGSEDSDVWTNKDVILTANPSGSLSGYSYKWYLSNELTNVISTDSSITINSSTNNKYVVKVINGAGTESEYSPLYSVKVDKDAPRCGSWNGQGSSWTSGNRTITNIASDSGSGTNSSFSKTYSSGTTKTEYVSYTAVDAVGNSRLCDATVNVYVDKEGPSLYDDSSHWYNSSCGGHVDGNLDIYFYATDSGSGISYCQWQCINHGSQVSSNGWLSIAGSNLSSSVYSVYNSCSGRYVTVNYHDVYKSSRNQQCWYRCIDNTGNIGNSIWATVNIN